MACVHSPKAHYQASVIFIKIGYYNLGQNKLKTFLWQM